MVGLQVLVLSIGVRVPAPESSELYSNLQKFAKRTSFGLRKLLLFPKIDCHTIRNDTPRFPAARDSPLRALLTQY